MNASIRKFTFFLTACLLAGLTGHAYEQDNWYLGQRVDRKFSDQVLRYYEDNLLDWNKFMLRVPPMEQFTINGSLGTITTARIDIVYDLNGSRLDRPYSDRSNCLYVMHMELVLGSSNRSRFTLPSKNYFANMEQNL